MSFPALFGRWSDIRPRLCDVTSNSDKCSVKLSQTASTNHLFSSCDIQVNHVLRTNTITTANCSFADDGQQDVHIGRFFLHYPNLQQNLCAILFNPKIGLRGHNHLANSVGEATVFQGNEISVLVRSEER